VLQLSTFYSDGYFLIRHWIKTMGSRIFAFPLNVPNLRLGVRCSAASIAWAARYCALID
jgi:hypothetical protein